MPNFDDEAKAAVKYDGVPPLEPNSSPKGTVVLANLSSVYVRAADGSGIQEVASVRTQDEEPLWAVVREGKLVCAGPRAIRCVQSALTGDAQYMDLEGGSIAPGLTSFGSPLGLLEIEGEASTKDGISPDGLSQSIPGIAGGSNAVVRATDGLQFGTRHALYVLLLSIFTSAMMVLSQSLMGCPLFPA